MEKKDSDIFRLIKVMNRLDGMYRMAAKVNGIKLNTLVLLYALGDGEPHSQKQICDEWLIPRTTLNTVVTECVNDGYISLLGVDHSKEKIIVVTKKGKDYIHKTMRNVYQAEHVAMEKTELNYPEPFTSALEEFAACLQEEFNQKIMIPEND